MGHINRRMAFGLGTAVAASTVLGTHTASAEEEEAIPTTADAAARRVRRFYEVLTAAAGGTWNSYVSVADPASPPQVAVNAGADELVEAYSVNKIAVAVAVLDKVDRGLISLDQRIDVPASIVIPDGDGILRLDGAYPSTVTAGHVLALLLTVSDDTCVRLCGLVCPALEVNEIIAGKGFPKTQVVPVANPNRFFLGKTTPRETHDLLRALAAGTLLSAASTGYLLKILRSPVAFTDGVRRNMSSADRDRVATKAGWFDDGRNEAGIVFDSTGKAVLTYSLFAHGQADAGNFGATHPAVQARAALGPVFLDAVRRLEGSGTAHRMAPYTPYNGT